MDKHFWSIGNQKDKPINVWVTFSVQGTYSTSKSVYNGTIIIYTYKTHCVLRLPAPCTVHIPQGNIIQNHKTLFDTVHTIHYKCNEENGEQKSGTVLEVTLSTVHVNA